MRSNPLSHGPHPRGEGGGGGGEEDSGGVCIVGFKLVAAFDDDIIRKL